MAAYRMASGVRAVICRVALGAAGLLLAAACGPRTAVEGPPPLPPAPHPAALGSTVAAVQRAGRLRVAADLSVPPMAFRGEAGPAGFDVDLIDLIAQSLGVRAEITDTPIAAMHDAFAPNEDLAAGALSAGMVPGVATDAYESAAPAIVWGRGMRGTTLDALRGKRVAVALGRPAERVARNAGAALLLTYLPEESLAMVGDGRADAAIVDGPEAMGFVAGRSGLHVSAVAGQAALLVIIVRPGADDLAAYVSSAIQELRAHGGLDQLRRRWHL